MFCQQVEQGDVPYHPRETTNMRTQTVASYFRVRSCYFFFEFFYVAHLYVPLRLVDCGHLCLVLADGPAVQDGGGTASLCALYQTQQWPSSQQVRPGEGPGPAEVHRGPGDGQDQTTGFLSPHPVCQLHKEVSKKDSSLCCGPTSLQWSTSGSLSEKWPTLWMPTHIET